MARKRWKRKSGYVTPDLTIPVKELFKHDLFLDIFYDDWDDYRDGLRDRYRDYKKIKNVKLNSTFSDETILRKRIHMNAKQRRLSKRRKVRKQVLLQKNNSDYPNQGGQY